MKIEDRASGTDNQLRIVNLSISSQRLLLAAETEALMEMTRAFEGAKEEKESLAILNEWAAEWTSRKILHLRFQAENTPHFVKVLDVERLRELDEIWAAQEEAQKQFQFSVDAKNCSLMLQWMDEWKSLNAHHQQLAKKFLVDFQPNQE